MSFWKGKSVLVTAGPTREAIDPVRFLSNPSTGKMGIAIADALAEKGATVFLLLGPSSEMASHPNVETIPVISAQDMYEASVSRFAQVDVAILSAAVSDYRPKTVSDQKIKKAGDELILELVRTKDILAELGKQKREDQFLVGFALETENEEANAIGKLRRKNLDMIVLNSLRDSGAGFEHETNKVRFIDRAENIFTFNLKSKKEVALDIVDHIEKAKTNL